MNITRDHVVTVHYTLTDDEGNVLDSSRGNEPLVYLQGHGTMIPGFEKALEGANKDSEHQFKIAAVDAYGEHDPEAIFEVERSEFPSDQDIPLGSQVQGQSESGHVRSFTVVGHTDSAIKLDGNHPLAGKTLHFDVQVVDVRMATAQEIEHSHVHADGHDH